MDVENALVNKLVRWRGWSAFIDRRRKRRGLKSACRIILGKGGERFCYSKLSLLESGFAWLIEGIDEHASNDSHQCFHCAHALLIDSRQPGNVPELMIMHVCRHTLVQIKDG